jgi:hypothetical protein
MVITLAGGHSGSASEARTQNIKLSFNMRRVRSTGDTTGQYPCRGINFHSSTVLRLALGTRTASYPIGTGGSFSRFKGVMAVKLTTHFQLVPRSRQRGSIHPLPHTPSWHRQEHTGTCECFENNHFCVEM